MDTSHSLGICTQMLQPKLCLVPRDAALVPCFGWRDSGDAEMPLVPQPIFFTGSQFSRLERFWWPQTFPPCWQAAVGHVGSTGHEEWGVDVLHEAAWAHSWHQERATEPNNTLQRANCSSRTGKEEKNNNFQSCGLRGSLLFLDLLWSISGASL